MLRRMEARRVYRGGIEIEVLDDRIDDYGPAIWIMAARTSEYTTMETAAQAESVVRRYICRPIT